jgi:hypothetical protein
MAIALGFLGRTPESRVKWALKFRLLDLSKLSERDRHRAWAMLLGWQRGRPERGPRPPAQDGVLEAQQALRECIEALANGLPDMIFMGETNYALWPAPRRRPGGRRSGQVTITTDYASPGGQPVTKAVVFAFVNDLNAIEADRLRVCPLKTDETPCGVIFLAARRQIFCSPRHAQAAAWQRYQPKRKERRP